jgi:hypothetical protein
MFPTPDFDLKLKELLDKFGPSADDCFSEPNKKPKICSAVDNDKKIKEILKTVGIPDVLAPDAFHELPESSNKMVPIEWSSPEAKIWGEKWYGPNAQLANFTFPPCVRRTKRKVCESEATIDDFVQASIKMIDTPGETQDDPEIQELKSEMIEKMRKRDDAKIEDYYKQLVLFY